jgi:hypothetical protein
MSNSRNESFTDFLRRPIEEMNTASKRIHLTQRTDEEIDRTLSPSFELIFYLEIHISTANIVVLFLCIFRYHMEYFALLQAIFSYYFHDLYV